MSDTQWPRYFVFKQDAEGDPHLNCGTVHAPDPELALQNARDVFVRRPDCVSLWVVRADQVTALSAERLAQIKPEPQEEERAREDFAVFLKFSHRDQHAHAGEVEAASPQGALALAFERWSEDGPTAYWVAPRRALWLSEQADESAWFGPAHDKPYRHQSYYQTENLMRKIRAEHERSGGRGE